MAKPKKCSNLQKHEPHVWYEGWRPLDCIGLKHKSKRRGMPRPPRRNAQAKEEQQ